MRASFAVTLCLLGLASGAEVPKSDRKSRQVLHPLVPLAGDPHGHGLYSYLQQPQILPPAVQYIQPAIPSILPHPIDLHYQHHSVIPNPAVDLLRTALHSRGPQVFSDQQNGADGNQSPFPGGFDLSRQPQGFLGRSQARIPFANQRVGPSTTPGYDIREQPSRYDESSESPRPSFPQPSSAGLNAQSSFQPLITPNQDSAEEQRFRSGSLLNQNFRALPQSGSYQQFPQALRQSQQSSPDFSQSQQSSPDFSQSQQSSLGFSQPQQSSSDFSQSQQSSPSFSQSQQSSSSFGQSQQSSPSFSQSQQSSSRFSQPQQSSSGFGQSQQTSSDSSQSQSSDGAYRPSPRLYGPSPAIAQYPSVQQSGPIVTPSFQSSSQSSADQQQTISIFPQQFGQRAGPAPQGDQQSQNQNGVNTPIISQSGEISHDGSYSYGFLSANGIQRSESGSMEAGPSRYVQGSYSYTAPDGTPVSANYYADQTGFHVQGSHIPSSSAVGDGPRGQSAQGGLQPSPVESN